MSCRDCTLRTQYALCYDGELCSVSWNYNSILHQFYAFAVYNAYVTTAYHTVRLTHPILLTMQPTSMVVLHIVQLLVSNCDCHSLQQQQYTIGSLWYIHPNYYRHTNHITSLSNYWCIPISYRVM